jgi:ABC-type Co2+ transport system permease subunit
VFAAMSGAVAAVGFVTSLARRAIGHLLAAVLGVVNLVFGVLAITHGQPGALTAVLLVTGCLVPALAYFSYRRSRAAWAFLAALCGVFAVVGLFGAPKISRVLDFSLWTMMIFPGLYVVACATLALLRDDYVEPAAARRA